MGIQQTDSSTDEQFKQTVLISGGGAGGGLQEKDT